MDVTNGHFGEVSLERWSFCKGSCRTNQSYLLQLARLLQQLWTHLGTVYVEFCIWGKILNGTSTFQPLKFHLPELERFEAHHCPSSIRLLILGRLMELI